MRYNLFGLKSRFLNSIGLQQYSRELMQSSSKPSKIASLYPYKSGLSQPSGRSKKGLVLVSSALFLLGLNGCKEAGEKDKTALGIAVRQEEIPLKTAPRLAVKAEQKDYLAIGFALLKSERIGLLKVELRAAEVLQILGPASMKSALETSEVDGEEHQQWSYRERGVSLGMITLNNEQRIGSLLVKSPSVLKTARGIALGSSRGEVMQAYESEIDLSEQSTSSALVAGTIYGGLMFTFKDDKVQTIFLGAGAE